VPELFTCSGGRINVATWDSFASYVDGAGLAGLRLLRLTGSPSVGAVRAVMCEDIGPGSYTDAALVVAAERLVADRHNWRFKLSPSIALAVDRTATVRCWPFPAVINSPVADSPRGQWDKEGGWYR
jgi:hypothetical protein